MGLNSLSVHHFRNLQSVSISTTADLILITGDNAAGKTSLLESIFYLSFGRSFRTHQVKHLIQHQSDHFLLLADTDSGSRIGIQRSNNEQSIRINQQSISRISTLSTELPVLALHPDSHQLISAGPEQRRQYIDWGVFHVEHQFISYWKAFRSALSQRNAALKAHQPDNLCALWNSQLVKSAELIEKARLNYLDRLKPLVNRFADVFFPGSELELVYRRGWPRDLSYLEYLESNLASDKDKGFTQSGPHRADLKITLNQQPTQTSVSRGQQKLLVCLLKMAQLSLFNQLTKQRCILLMDDLPAELDTVNQNSLLEQLTRLDVQVFITAIDTQQIDLERWPDRQVFHVEHGCVTEVK